MKMRYVIDIHLVYDGDHVLTSKYTFKNERIPKEITSKHTKESPLNTTLPRRHSLHHFLPRRLQPRPQPELIKRLRQEHLHPSYSRPALMPLRHREQRRLPRLIRHIDAKPPISEQTRKLLLRRRLGRDRAHNHVRGVRQLVQPRHGNRLEQRREMISDLFRRRKRPVDEVDPPHAGFVEREERRAGCAPGPDDQTGLQRVLCSRSVLGDQRIQPRPVRVVAGNESLVASLRDDQRVDRADEPRRLGLDVAESVRVEFVWHRHAGAAEGIVGDQMGDIVDGLGLADLVCVRESIVRESGLVDSGRDTEGDAAAEDVEVFRCRCHHWDVGLCREGISQGLDETMCVQLLQL